MSCNLHGYRVFNIFVQSKFKHTVITMEKKTAILMLQDGTTYKGTAIGAVGTTTGEICFNTSMTGYQEIYTDPSYYGQIIVNTVSHR